jgi:membrane protein DedA with SNARE-associated domain
VLEHSSLDLAAFVAAFGYIAVFLAVAIESTGVPFPGETTLVLATAYAAATGELSLPLVIAAAAGGAIVGDNFGYWLGREGGYRLLVRYGKYVRVDDRKLRIGQYFFWKHGRKVVLLGRFVAVLRAWAAFLAGVNGMPWRTFTIFNVAGGIIWATVFGVGGYTVGANIQKFHAPWYVIVGGLALSLVGFGFVVKRGEARLMRQAEAEGFTPKLARARPRREGAIPSPVFALLLAGLLFGLAELWLLAPTPLIMGHHRHLGDWPLAVGAAYAWRSIALGAALLVSLIPLVMSLTKRRRPF